MGIGMGWRERRHALSFQHQGQRQDIWGSSAGGMNEFCKIGKGNFLQLFDYAFI